ncbi:MAG: hypothetical protein KGL39_26360, partial [Patescibacteria group bacterium]|nr:hypothetical protein [Patescibacteria group bacterium]
MFSSIPQSIARAGGHRPMRRLLVVATCLYPIAAFAQWNQGGYTPPPPGIYVVNVKNYGACGNDICDDTAAINAAFAAARASVIGGDQLVQVVFPIGKYKTTGDINATGFNSIAYGTQIVGQGAEIDCQDTGVAPNLGVCLDMLGDRFVTVRDLAIVGSATSTPKIGIQFGRTNITSLNSADTMALDNVFVHGSFSETAIINLNSETSTFLHSRFWNAAASAYALIQDGINHFNTTSQFVTENQPANTAQSFIQD